MECLRASLKENGFKIGTGIVTTVNTLSGDAASDIGIENYINSFREAISPASMEYTLALAGDLRYRYNTRTHGIMGTSESTKEVSVKEVGASILEYAHKTFPKAFLPPEGK